MELYLDMFGEITKQKPKENYLTIEADARWDKYGELLSTDVQIWYLGMNSELHRLDGNAILSKEIHEQIEDFLHEAYEPEEREDYR